MWKIINHNTIYSRLQKYGRVILSNRTELSDKYGKYAVYEKTPEFFCFNFQNGIKNSTDLGGRIKKIYIEKWNEKKYC